MDAAAVALLGLERSLDGGPSEESRTGENRGSVPEDRLHDPDSTVVTSSAAYVPCDTHRPLVHCAAGSSRGWVQVANAVQIALNGPIYRTSTEQRNHIAPLPYFGIGRMLDFGQLGSASLWKSGPLFSTGTKEAELMVKELRVELAVAGTVIGGLPRER